MKKFDQMFAEAVKILLEEKGSTGTQKGGQKSQEDPKRPRASDAIVWKPGQGRWSDAIRGLKKDADVSYEEAISKSSAVGARSASLMAKLTITKKSTIKDTLQAANQILEQAVSSPIMSNLYEKPIVAENEIRVPIKLPMDDESVSSGDGVSGRNATVFIHLTLIGAYNAKMFVPAYRLTIDTATEESGAVIIKRS